MKRLGKLLAVLLAFALVAAACGDDDDAGTTTTTAATTSTTTAAFEGLEINAPNCDYGGKVQSIKALDRLTVEFTFCSPVPACATGRLSTRGATRNPMKKLRRSHPSFTKC